MSTYSPRAITLDKTALGSGSEFRVNTAVSGSQNILGTIKLDNGGFLVLGEPSDGTDQYWGQRYDADGLAQESQFNWTYPSNVSSVKVSGQGDGGFVLVWQRDGGDGSYDVFAQRYDSDAVASGTEFQVSASSTDASYKYPRVIDFADGSFVVSWVTYNADGSSDIAGQRFDASGSVVGNIYQVNGDDGSNHSKLIVTGSESGEFTVVWTVSDSTGAVTGLSGQHFDVAGNKSGSVFSVTDTENLGHPKAATLSNGHTVVVWQELAGTENSYDKSFYGRIFDQSGSPVKDAFEIDTDTGFNNHSKYGYAVEALSGGGFAVTWQPQGQDGSGEGVFGRIFAADGIAVSDEIAINANTFNNQYNKSLAALDDGGFVSIWKSWGQDGSGFGVYGQRFDAAGNAVELVSYAQGASGDILENSAGAVVGTLTVTDADGDDSHTLTLSGADAGSFEVLDGQLKLKDDVSADYETQSSYSVTVTATYSGGLSYSEDLKLSVTDLSYHPGPSLTLTGKNSDDQFGRFVSEAGDINGDGFDDFIVSSTGADDSANGLDNVGETYVIYGQADLLTPPIDLGQLDGGAGFTIRGGIARGTAGHQISGAGDINNDGYDDIIIGAHPTEVNGVSRAGSAYVVFGQSNHGDVVNLTSLDGSNGFSVVGLEANEKVGIDVSSIGDFNNDGFDDVLIGVKGLDGASAVDTGGAYVIYGRADGFQASYDSTALDGSLGFKVTGVDAYDYAGNRLSGAGDFNNDGYDDFILSALGPSQWDAADAVATGDISKGEAYLVYGTNSMGVSLELSTLDSSQGLLIQGIAVDDQAGASVSAAGDVNGDGYGDIIIGASRADSDSNTNDGASYVVFGREKSSNSSLDLTTLDGSNGFKVTGAGSYDYSGSQVSSAGDFNGDGYSDLLISSQNRTVSGQTKAGEAYVLYGKGSGFAATVSLDSINEQAGFVISGTDAYERFGSGISSAGDINQDGYSDLVIGGNGQATILYGHDERLSTKGSEMVDTIAPVFSSATTATVVENAAIATVVYNAEATDNGGSVDAGITYSLDGTDASAFDIVAGTGFVTLKTSADYETKNSYSIDVKATDETGNLATQTVDITVTDDLIDNDTSGNDIQAVNFTIVYNETNQRPYLQASLDLGATITEAFIQYIPEPFGKEWKVDLAYNPETGLFEVNQALDPHLASGEYRLSLVALTDGLGNYITVTTSQLQAHGYQTQTNLDNPNGDSIAPELISIELSDWSQDTEGDFILSVSGQASDNQSGFEIEGIKVWLETPSDEGYLILESIAADGSFSGTATFSTYTASGEYKVSKVALTDKAGNYQSFHSDDSTLWVDSENLRSFPKVTLNNPNGDSEAPVLEKLDIYAVFDAQANRPKIVFEGLANDELSGFRNIFVGLEGPQGGEYITGGYSVDDQSGLNFEFGMSLLSEYIPGTYEIERFYVYDNVDNVRNQDDINFAQLNTQASINVYFPASADDTVIDASDANDYVFGSDTAGDTLNAGKGDDYIYAGDGDDVVNAGDGNDHIVGGSGQGDDYYSGGSGVDEISYTSALAGIEVDLVKGQAKSRSADEANIGTDTLVGIENVIAGYYDDILTGNDLDNRIEAKAGNDQISTGTGADLIYADVGADTIHLSADSTWTSGFVALNVDNSQSVGTRERVTLEGLNRFTDVLDGGDDIDTLVLTNGSDVFALDDVYSDLHSSLTLSTTSQGIDSTARLVDIETINAGDGNDIVDLTSDNFVLTNAVTINGEAGNDVLWGSNGDDTINGGSGDDSIFGGAGNDTLTGGQGFDFFQFTATSGLDVITDFSLTDDVIRLFYREGDDHTLEDLDLDQGILTWDVLIEDVDNVVIDLSATTTSSDLADLSPLITFVEIA